MLQSLFTPAALETIQADTRFVEAARLLAAGSLREIAQADATGRWMFRDLGRSSLYLSALVLDAMPEGLSAVSMAAMAKGANIASRGRVVAFLARAIDAGEIELTAGAKPWTQRRLRLKKVFVDRFRSGNRVYGDAVAVLWPETAPLGLRLDDDAFLRRLAFWSGVASRIATLSGVTGGAEALFLERDRGMSILFRLLLSQDHVGPHLLASAALSRNGLSRELGVSRVHINRLLADAMERGLITCPQPDRVVFSERLTLDFERMIAVTLQIARGALLTAADDTVG